ncbi:MAG: hypothetical protein ACE147_07900 [Candidatus Methylomirabilales bacterium]
MATWRVVCVLLGVLALVLAAVPAGSELAAWLPGAPDARGRILFWVGVIFAAAAIWRRGGG